MRGVDASPKVPVRYGDVELEKSEMPPLKRIGTWNPRLSPYAQPCCALTTVVPSSSVEPLASRISTTNVLSSVHWPM